jgi:hypothetical protein
VMGDERYGMESRRGFRAGILNWNRRLQSA